MTARGAGLGLAAAGVGIGLATVSRRVADLDATPTRLLSRHRTPMLDSLAGGLDTLLGPPNGFLLAVGVGAATLVLGRPATGRYAVTASAAWGASWLAKRAFRRARPSREWVHPGIEVTLQRDSFPSGHTATATAIACGVAAALKSSGRSTTPVVLVSSPLVATVAWSRLYIGAHHASDVVGAVVLGTGVSLWLAPTRD